MKKDSEILGPEKVLDREDSLGRLGGDEELYKEVCDIFLSDSPANLEILRNSLADNQSAESIRRLHSFKGAAANIGAMKLSRVAGELEVLASSGKLEEVSSKFQILEDTLSELLSELEE